MKIRFADSKDLKSLADLFSSYLKFYKTEKSPAELVDFLNQRISKKESLIWVCEDSSGLLGFVQVYPSFSSLSLKALWILNDLFVLESARRKGIARKLIECVQIEAKKSGVVGLSLMTGIENTSAQKLYESLGWKKVEEYFSYTFRF